MGEREGRRKKQLIAGTCGREVIKGWGSGNPAWNLSPSRGNTLLRVIGALFGAGTHILKGESRKFRL